tara:strand:- start:126 stop:464 length:339 start_codon:yes stop_codon:yes gene_type:complete
MVDEPPVVSNVVHLHPHKPNITMDVGIGETELTPEETHHFVLSSMDKVQEEIRNNSKVNGAFVLSFSEDGTTDNWIMGDVKVTLLYTALSSIQNEILKVFNGAEEHPFKETD